VISFSAKVVCVRSTLSQLFCWCSLFFVQRARVAACFGIPISCIVSFLSRSSQARSNSSICEFLLLSPLYLPPKLSIVRVGVGC
jgi:hypothetical protein